jgi:hypothetical protein
MKQNIDLTTITHGFSNALQKIKPYTGLMFFVMLSLMYGFLILQINILSAAPVDNNEVTTQISSSPTLNVDPKAAQQLQTLKDNSGNVHTLFDQNRTNPFQE